METSALAPTSRMLERHALASLLQPRRSPKCFVVADETLRYIAFSTESRSFPSTQRELGLRESY
jgi:hypothetical protein